MTATTVPAAAEVRRLRAELAEVTRQRDALLAADQLSIPARRAVGEAAYAGGLADGWRDGYEQAHRDMAASWRRYLAPVQAPGQIERTRWHVCCGSCRRGGHRAGCTRCEDRTRATFGQPHPDDYQDGSVAA